MIDPLFWLGFSLLLVAVSLAAVLIVALPAVQELARAARSAEKLFDTLNRELPPTLEAIRLTGLEVSNLTDEMNEGVQNAGRIVQQLDQSISGVGQQAKQAQIVTHSIFAGVKAALKSFTQPTANPRSVTHRGKPSQPKSGIDLDQGLAQPNFAKPVPEDCASFGSKVSADDAANTDNDRNSSNRESAQPVLVESDPIVDEWDQEEIDETEIRSHFIP